MSWLCGEIYRPWLMMSSVPQPAVIECRRTQNEVPVARVLLKMEAEDFIDQNM